MTIFKIIIDFMTANELREKYLDFFRSKGHTVIGSASLIPENDPTVLFTTAGMHPLVPYLMGEKHPAGTRLTDVQKCVRTGDIDEVGDATHHTFFEMLGNWSLGDYFKKEAIEWSWEFLTEVLKLNKNRIAVSVFAGDDDPGDEHGASAPFDEEAYNLWKQIFEKNNLPIARIAKLPKKNNWWGPAGVTGPCGTDTEMFYWTGDPDNIPASFNDDNNSWVEIWNDVFMQYNKNKAGKFEPLAQKNVDTGMGLERTLAVINGFDDNYRTELFWPIIQKIEELSGKKYENNKRAMRIIADHIKAAILMIADGVVPEKNGRGYVLRRLIRRANYYYNSISAKENTLLNLIDRVVSIYKDVYLESVEKNKYIENIVIEEEMTFVGHLMFGRKFIEKIIAKEKYISDDTAFLLYSTYGFPFELIVDIAKEKNIKVDVEGFNIKKAAHQDLSRTASAGMFKGGLADASEETKKLHTAAHLMLESLRRVLGPHVSQKGSNITAERLRFDFSHTEKMTPEQIKQVEDLVNEQIAKDLPVRCEEMLLEQARALGATGVFDSKYGEKVKVYIIGEGENNFSKEICGGPHVEHTGELGHFKIQKEESSSAGVRRIKAVLNQ